MPVYPLQPDQQERESIDKLMPTVAKNLTTAEDRFDEVKSALGRPTEMWLRGAGRDFFGILGRRDILLRRVKEHHFRTALFVSLRFWWNPDEIMALWQTEGLPTFVRKEADVPSPIYQSLASEDLFPNKSPRDGPEARSWARSAILWQRWGLDVLAPTAWDPNKRDTKLRAGSKEMHDKAFETGFGKEVQELLLESPLAYLNEKSGPIEVRAEGRNWSFRTKPEYQATVLAMQHARYRLQLKRIPPIFEVDGVRVHTRTVFPALLYWHYNSRRHVESQANKKGELEQLATEMVKVAKRNALKQLQGEFSGSDLYQFYIRSPIPKKIQDNVEREGLIAEAYVNALRFELVRQVYAIVFEGTCPNPRPEQGPSAD